MNLKGKNVVVFDLEIKKPVKECSKGWASLDEMGISVGCAYDYRESRYRVFLDDNIQGLVDRLNEPGTLVVAFNHIRFDNELLRKSGFALKPDEELNNYDMLLVSREGARVQPMTPGFKLDDHLKAIGLPQKTGLGANAPLLFKAGKMGELIDYCMNDVTQEKTLFEWMSYTGLLACAHNNRNFFRIRKAELA